MNDLLIDVPVQLSPRLAWMKFYGVRTFAFEGADGGTEWMAWCGAQNAFEVHSQPERTAFRAFAGSEDEATARHASRRGLRLWNEPQALELEGVIAA